jgi:putative transposase
VNASRPNRWANRAKGGECAFITTRCLDWADCFESCEQKDAVSRSLLSDCHYYNAELHSFVVMSKDIHLLLNVPEGRTVTWLVQRLKTNSAKLLMPMQSQHQLDALSLQSGLSRHVMWQKGFRSLVITSADAFDTRTRYIEQNPVRADICDDPTQYRWSSLCLVANGICNEYGDLDIGKALEFYR